MGKWKDGEDGYIELTEEGIAQFKTILRAIQKYHQSLTLRSENTKGSPWDFKRGLLKAKDCRIYVKATEDKHVFKIYAEIIESGQVLNHESWYHIDGIAEAREVFERDGNMTNHPVFNIRCLSDLYRDNTK
ncbi:hypothetical protein FH597_14010 [Leptospira interrogans]|uniref:LIC_13246 family protein n=1 Tax=Leptospira interrogans TaxID=173 RepID=UPI001EF070D4|nr:hypothetical protein [Leptospira interrogans]ULG76290.1 hypothetical protein FH597_14010 [Leptospira interrogans]